VAPELPGTVPVPCRRIASALDAGTAGVVTAAEPVLGLAA